MGSSSNPPTSEDTWDKIDRSDYDEERWRKAWLPHESFLQAHGYTLAYPSSQKYREIFANCANVPIKPPQDPFHPRADEAFGFLEPGMPPLRSPMDVGKVVAPAPSVHPGLDSRGRAVILKAVRSSSTELTITRLLSSDLLRADPRNHTIPVRDMLNLGEWTIVVTAEWGFGYWSPCASLKEYLEFARQLFEGLAFMHENGIVHGDIHDFNLVMNHQGGCSKVVGFFDPFPRDFGPGGAKYAFIDFGESHLVRDGDSTRLPAELNFHLETAAPELFKDDPVNLFCCDVYALGAVLRQQVEKIEHYILRKNVTGLISIVLASPEYIQLIDALTHEDAQKRPTAMEALARIEDLLLETDSKNLNPDMVEV